MTQTPEPIFDRSLSWPGGGPVDPLVYEASLPALRQRTVNFAARRYADMMMVTGLDRLTADRHFRLRAAVVPAGLDTRSVGPGIQAEANAAFAAGQINIETDVVDGRVSVRWGDVRGLAVSRPGYGSTLLRPGVAPGFDPRPIARHFPHAGRSWPVGDAVEPAAAAPALAGALDAFFASSPGAYGVLVASPERVLAERYSPFGAADRATPSWSMTKAITCTVIGRLVHDGWLRSMYDPAAAPLWSDPRSIHRLITLDHLVRMRSGLGFPVRHEDVYLDWVREQCRIS